MFPRPNRWGRDGRSKNKSISETAEKKSNIWIKARLMFKWLSNWFIKMLKHQTYVPRTPTRWMPRSCSEKWTNIQYLFISSHKFRFSIIVGHCRRQLHSIVRLWRREDSKNHKNQYNAIQETVCVVANNKISFSKRTFPSINVKSGILRTFCNLSCLVESGLPQCVDPNRSFVRVWMVKTNMNGCNFSKQFRGWKGSDFVAETNNFWTSLKIKFFQSFITFPDD